VVLPVSGIFVEEVNNVKWPINITFCVHFCNRVLFVCTEGFFAACLYSEFSYFLPLLYSKVGHNFYILISSLSVCFSEMYVCLV
jgi:hypothetical protein